MPGAGWNPCRFPAEEPSLTFTQQIAKFQGHDITKAMTSSCRSPAACLLIPETKQLPLSWMIENVRTFHGSSWPKLAESLKVFPAGSKAEGVS